MSREIVREIPEILSATKNLSASIVKRLVEEQRTFLKKE